ncbi:MAG: hypothetical protein LBN23_00415 [Paludibacter sp.]|jgi:hypothetical protein|nr:hypothetical protein [Paludibacter sp.]
MTILIIIIAVVAIYIFKSGITFKKTDPGVIINGVEWATCNLSGNGFFTREPEHKGKLIEGADVSNDYCPRGWRLPQVKEFTALFDEDKVSIEKAQLNGTTGMRFVDKDTGCSMFLPAAGNRGAGSIKRGGYYWCSDFVDLGNDRLVGRYVNKFIVFGKEYNPNSIEVSYYTKFGIFAKQSIRAVRET